MSIFRTPIVLAIVACMSLNIFGCKNTIPRMNSNFNAQPLGVPQQFPTPSPPNDHFIWLRQKPLSSEVTSNPSGGNWVLTVPKPAFIADPDLLHQFLLATSEPFNTDPLTQINGQFSIRLLGPGTVSFGIRATRGSVSGFIGGGDLSTSSSGSAEIGILLNASFINNLEPYASRDFPVTGLTTYSPGHVALFHYSIDQQSRNFNISANVLGGSIGSQSTNYNFSGAIQQLELWLFLRQPSSNTQVFVNEVKMNEIK